MKEVHADIAVVGAGAAGLMAAIQAGRCASGRRVVLVEGARRPGAKILISGGGRCNVTHHEVDAAAFAGSSRHAIGKVLRSFDVSRTVDFFREIGVELKREATGKLFPVTDSARTVLASLFGAADSAGVELIHPLRVNAIVPDGSGFRLLGEQAGLRAARVVLATGGRSVPRSGSDGHGYEIARQLGHSVTRTFPALVPLTLPPAHWITTLSGLSLEAGLCVRSATGRVLASVRGSTLCTHFGLSGPAPLDISRFLIEARIDDPRAGLWANWMPGESTASLLEQWVQCRDPVGRVLRQSLPRRFADALCATAGLDAVTPVSELGRQARQHLARCICEHPLPVTGDRGFDHAEVTAGGVPLAELQLPSMQSRVRPGLFLCGEICDVDGRIGGFNFQWAWASGYLAGSSAAQGLHDPGS